MTITLKYEYKEPLYLTECTYTLYYNQRPKIGSIFCKVLCKHNRGIDFDNQTVDCSYEYDHLTEQENWRNYDSNIKI